jgi:hypothetical protein
MTKKAYITPETRAVALHVEGALLEASKVSIRQDADPDAKQLTNRYSWDSSNWTDSEEE